MRIIANVRDSWVAGERADVAKGRGVEEGGGVADGEAEEDEVWTNRRYRIEKVMLNAIFSMQF